MEETLFRGIKNFLVVMTGVLKWKVKEKKLNFIKSQSFNKMPTFLQFFFALKKPNKLNQQTKQNPLDKIYFTLNCFNFSKPELLTR